MNMIGHNRKVARGSGKSMYAVVFDLDTNSLKDVYPGESWNNAYAEIRRFLADRGFGWQQGSTYFGDENVDAVSCVLTIQELTDAFDWFSASVRDIRMLRIEENNDLMPAVERTAAAKSRKGRA
ncbi:virulence factor [Rhizobium sp. L1K21]|uniref:virulence factor n=1 Tax=Rhizobium sp. L1K21 TaxID=2954933 RepID=UPI002091FB39|nr:virulence factor [Rhizobium sp. L1K21]MCO6184885.1 virulence factor [Rhizobium sp. L1K21]